MLLGTCGQFVEQQLMLSSSFRRDQIYKCRRYDFGHILLCYYSYIYSKMIQDTKMFSHQTILFIFESHFGIVKLLPKKFETKTKN